MDTVDKLRRRRNKIENDYSTGSESSDQNVPYSEIRDYQ